MLLRNPMRLISGPLRHPSVEPISASRANVLRREVTRERNTKLAGDRRYHDEQCIEQDGETQRLPPAATNDVRNKFAHDKGCESVARPER